jgi:cytochrome oxidase Cu insertion factor (SCO1/SenC/PrrC family)
MKNINRTASRWLLALFFWVLFVAGICQRSQAQDFGPNTREGRFGKLQLENALQNANKMVSASAEANFYDAYIKEKTVLINFFYAQCDQGVCDQVMGKLAKVQQLLGDRVGRDRFIVSITLDSKDDTAEALRTYARGIEARPGWSFLRGNVKEIDDLRTRLGLGKASPEFIRSLNLNAVSSEVAEAGKTIEARSPTEWTPRSLRALVGDRVVWKIGGASAGKHGLQITNWEVVKPFVEVESVEGQEPFNAATGRNDGSTEAAGKVLVRLKIKSEPAVPTKITYNCWVQGKAMAGDVLLGQQHTGMLFAYSDRTKRHSLISFDATPNEIKNTLADLEGTVGPAPVVGSAALPEIIIDAGPGRVWKSGGNSSRPATPTTPAVPLQVTAKKGQTLVFRQVETAPNRPHGIVFTTTALVQLNGETKPGAVLKQIDNFGLYGVDVPGAPNPQELARFEVIQDISDVPSFMCTVHLTDMVGNVEPAPASRSADATEVDPAVATMPPSVQRRLLRFVNQAYKPEDLLKSPQDTRMKSEHVPANAEKRGSDAKAGFPKEVAASLIERRPVNGYRELHECLPSYEKAGGLRSMENLLESIGPKQFGQWNEVVSQTLPVMHAALLHTGEVLMITDSTTTVLWDSSGGQPKVLSGATTGLTDNLFCSGHSFLSDGRLLAVGGGGGSSADALNSGWKFDPTTKKWSRTGNKMAFERWYPSLVTLGHEPERILVAAGATRFDGLARRMEVYSEATDRFETVTTTGPAGELLFPGLYPSMRVLPGGEILHVATGWGGCDQEPDGTPGDPTAIFTFSSPLSGAWKTLGNNHRMKGMAALLIGDTFPFLQSLVVGGGNASKSATAQTMNLTSMSPSWDPPFSLLEARVHPNIVVLPDGTVFICGGKESSAPTPPNGGRCELFDPRSGAVALTEMDEMIRFRHYHSMAILLPDGRVMAAGGARDGACSVSTQNTIEVFSPPYLFRGPRPVIASTSAPNKQPVEHGTALEIKTASAADIRRIVLARPMAVTHQTDSEQRIIPLSFKVTGPDSIEAQLPGGAGQNPIAPSGYYMLFILNSEGVPSVSEWIRLGKKQADQNGQASNTSGPTKDDANLEDRNGVKRSLGEFAGKSHVVVLIKGAACRACMEQLIEFQKRLAPSGIPMVVITPSEEDFEGLSDFPIVFADPRFQTFRKFNAFRDGPLHATRVYGEKGQLVLANPDDGEEPYTDFDAVKKALNLGATLSFNR